MRSQTDSTTTASHEHTDVKADGTHHARSYSLRLTRRLDVRPCLELRRECRQVLPIRCPLKSRSATDAAPDDVTHAPLPRRSEPPAAALDQSHPRTQRFLVPSPQFRLPSSVLAECSVTLQFALPPFSSNAGSFRHRKGNDTRDDLIAPPHVPSPVISPFLPQTQTRPNRETHTPTLRRDPAGPFLLDLQIDTLF